MAIQFSINKAGQPGQNAVSFNYANRRAARRQTEEQRNRVFSKYQALVGTVFKNSMAARRAASKELNDPDKTPEYWNEDTKPRRELNMSSTCFSKAVPAAGGVFLYFQSNPEKGYFYPSAGTTEATAKRLERLISAGSIGGFYHSSWGKQNGAKKVMSKSGKSYSYRMKGGGSLDIRKFDKMAEKWSK